MQRLYVSTSRLLMKTQKIFAAITLLLALCLPANAADELIAEHVFATVGNVNTVTYGTPGSPDEVIVSCTGGAYSSGAYMIHSGSNVTTQYVQVSVLSASANISKIEVNAYTSNTRKTFYKFNTDDSTWGSASQITLTKTDDTYTLPNNQGQGQLYFRVGGLTTGSGEIGSIPAPGRGNPTAGSVQYNGNDAEGIIYIYSSASAIDITSIAVAPATAIDSVNASKAIASETSNFLTSGEIRMIAKGKRWSNWWRGKGFVFG
jgi:hypothetical protein